MGKDDVVKIYVGTDPHMGKAELALEYSIEQTCSQPFEIIWMDYSRGEIWNGWNIGREREQPYSGTGWATDFTCFRFAIPEANHFEGRAIYIDVDMLLLKDISELFNYPMTHPIMITPRGFDVMLIDCAAFKDKEWWPSLEKMKESGWLLQYYDQLLHAHDGVGRNLPTKWNCLDGKGFDEDYTALVHFTDMNTQPWKPFPEVFDYPQHPREDMVKLFWDTYEAACEAKGIKAEH